MKSKTMPGKYSKSFIGNIPADLDAPEVANLKKVILKFPEEAVYIYSFKQNKMLYADGWENVLGYKDAEITMLTILNITSPEYEVFANELNDKALMFLQQKTENLEEYSYTIELKKIHKNGELIPLISRVKVFGVENGKMTEIIGRVQVSRNINLGKVMYYAAYGPEKAEFEENLNKALFKHYAISRKEKEALLFIAEGKAFKEIAHYLNVSQSAIEKRIIPMYKRFGVKSIAHLISFAYDNHILP
jgi:DNA-binding CsgD family transcriptional regulator